MHGRAFSSIVIFGKIGLGWVRLDGKYRSQILIGIALQYDM